jgi:catechol 2,3-dioxygenase-like lactoylglutathione lyase family enzyme
MPLNHPAAVGLDHVQLAMPPGREDDATAFYEGLLGIPRVPKPPELAKRGGCWFEHPTLRLHLGVEDDFRPARKAHPALVVRDLTALADTLRQAGVKTSDGENFDGRNRMYADDPFGNRIELIDAG